MPSSAFWPTAWWAFFACPRHTVGANCDTVPNGMAHFASAPGPIRARFAKVYELGEFWRIPLPIRGGSEIPRLPSVQLPPGRNSTHNENPSLDALGKLTATNSRATQSGEVTSDGRTDRRTDARTDDGRTDGRRVTEIPEGGFAPPDPPHGISWGGFAPPDPPTTTFQKICLRANFLK